MQRHEASLLCLTSKGIAHLLDGECRGGPRNQRSDRGVLYTGRGFLGGSNPIRYQVSLTAERIGTQKPIAGKPVLGFFFTESPLSLPSGRFAPGLTRVIRLGAPFPQLNKGMQVNINIDKTQMKIGYAGVVNYFYTERAAGFPDDLSHIEEMARERVDMIMALPDSEDLIDTGEKQITVTEAKRAIQSALDAEAVHSDAPQ